MSQTNEMALEVGITFTVEPGIYPPDSFGVRIEEDVAVTSEEGDVLTKMSKDLLIV